MLTFRKTTPNDLSVFPYRGAAPWTCSSTAWKRRSRTSIALPTIPLVVGLTQSESAGADSFSRLSDSGRTTFLMEGTVARL